MVPVLDEAEALPALLAELRGLGLLGRTLFVDNGSSDGGPDLILAAGARLLREPRRGYGYPCLTGARAAAARAPAPSSSWRPTAPTTRPRCGISSGRSSPASPISSSGRGGAPCVAPPPASMPLHQRLGNDWLALNLRLLFGLRLSDDGPFRAVRTDLLERLRLEERAYAFPTEMAVKARLAGARIAVRDTRYRRRAGSSKIAGTWRGSALAVRDISWCLLRLRLFGFRP